MVDFRSKEEKQQDQRAAARSRELAIREHKSVGKLEEAVSKRLQTLEARLSQLNDVDQQTKLEVTALSDEISRMHHDFQQGTREEREMWEAASKRADRRLTRLADIVSKIR